MIKLLSLTIALIASLSSDLLAMTTYYEMVPGNLGTQFNLSKSERADGTWFFTLIRSAPPASCHASLSIVDENGAIVAHMELAPTETKDGHFKFCFSISKSLAKNSRLELSENPQSTGPLQEVGWGEIYSFSLIDFIENTSGIERFLRRHKIDIESLGKPDAKLKDDEPSVAR